MKYIKTFIDGKFNCVDNMYPNIFYFKHNFD
jgi:hypothetical protein